MCNRGTRGVAGQHGATSATARPCACLETRISEGRRASTLRRAGFSPGPVAAALTAPSSAETHTRQVCHLTRPVAQLPIRLITVLLLQERLILRAIYFPMQQFGRYAGKTTYSSWDLCDIAVVVKRA